MATLTLVARLVRALFSLGGGDEGTPVSLHRSIAVAGVVLFAFLAFKTAQPSVRLTFVALTNDTPGFVTGFFELKNRTRRSITAVSPWFSKVPALDSTNRFIGDLLLSPVTVGPNQSVIFKTFIPQDGGVWKLGLFWEPQPERRLAMRCVYWAVLHLPKVLQTRLYPLISPIKPVTSPPFRTGTVQSQRAEDTGQPSRTNGGLLPASPQADRAANETQHPH